MVSGKGARGKGSRGEREIVQLLAEYGIEAHKVSRSGYTGADILVNGVLAEVKRQESMSKKDWEWLDQTDDAKILFKRVNGKRWLVVMDLDTYANQ